MENQIILLDADEKVHAEKIHAEHPELVSAVVAYKDATVQHVDKYRAFVKALRVSGLSPREMTLFLLSEGFAKSNASALNAVANLPEPQFQAFETKAIGFKAAVLEARAQRNGITAVEAKNRQAISGKGLASFSAFVNSIDPADYPQKKAFAVVNRLELTFTLVVKRKAPRAAKTAKAVKGKAKVKAKK